MKERTSAGNAPDRRSNSLVPSPEYLRYTSNPKSPTYRTWSMYGLTILGHIIMALANPFPLIMSSIPPTPENKYPMYERACINMCVYICIEIEWGCIHHHGLGRVHDLGAGSQNPTWKSTDSCFVLQRSARIVFCNAVMECLAPSAS